MPKRKGWQEITLAPGRARLRLVGDEWHLDCRQPRAMLVLTVEQMRRLHEQLDGEEQAANLARMTVGAPSK